MAAVRVRGGVESGQASLLMLGVCTLLLGLAVVLFAFGSALGSKGRHQRAADLAAVSAGQVMRDLYPRLFEPPVLANGLPNPRHLPLPVYLALVRRAAVRGARRNGVEVQRGGCELPGRWVRADAGGGHGPRRRARAREDRAAAAVGSRVPVKARAVAEIAPDSERPARDAGVRFGRRLRRAAGVPDGQADAPRRGGRVRPHGRRRARGGRPVPVDQQRLPLRRRAGQTVRRRTRTRSGSRRPAPACTAMAPSSTSGRRPPTPGSTRTPAASASSTATPGSRGTTASAPTRATVSTPRATTRARGSRRGATTAV